MKTIILSVAAALIAPVAFGQQSAPLPPLVSTNGSAQIRVVPDLADLSFEVEVRNVDLTIARKQQSERAAKVLAALRAAGVSEAELQSSQVQITPDYTDRRQETERIKFYRVSQTICCTLHDVKKVPDVTAEAAAAGATGVRGASLRASHCANTATRRGQRRSGPRRKRPSRSPLNSESKSANRTPSRKAPAAIGLSSPATISRSKRQ